MHLRIARIGLTSTFILTATLVGAAGDWPQWRGPQRDGHSADKNLLSAWPQGGPPLVWKTNGVGHGYSSVAVADGKIFTVGDGPESSFVYAVALNGSHLWMAKVGKI